MEKEIALPDTYANYDTLKPILEKQGYSIQKMEKMEKNYNKGGSLSEKTIFLKTQREARKLEGYYNDGGKVGITNCQVLDRNGERKIDLDSIEKMTDCLNEQPQTKFMHFDYDKNDYEPERKKLHRKIIYDFKKDLICVESDEPIAILMGGSPASGKSTFLKKYAPYLLKEEIFKIDADEIRSKLPEYKGFNATQTHLETKDIVNTLLSDRNIGIPCRFDLIYDGTMNNTKSYLPLINILKKDGYKVFIVYIDKVPKDVIVKRALERYKKSGRFVPLEVIDDFFEKGTAALEQLKNSVDGYMIIDGSSTDYKIIEKGGKKLPQDRNYSKIGEPIKITTEDVVREFKKGGEIDPDDNSIKDAITHKSGSAGGLLVGNRHSEGGIKAVNKSTNQMLEMEGGEIVITRDAVSDEQKREFEGEMLTNREILSRINVSGGGVSFADGGDVPSSCSCSGKKYNYGGSLKTDYEIIDSINKPTTKEIAMNYYAEGGMVTVDNPIGNGEISIPTLNYFVKKAYVLQQNGVKYIPKYDELYQSVIYYRNGDKRSKKMSTFDGYKFFINQKFAVPFEKLSDSVKKILIGK
jgi:predicted ABC-type ATPase